MDFQKEALNWRLEAYGKIIRGAEETSEDQVGKACCEEMASRMVTCFNKCQGISTDDLAGMRLVNDKVLYLAQEGEKAMALLNEMFEADHVAGPGFENDGIWLEAYAKLQKLVGFEKTTCVLAEDEALSSLPDV